MRGARFHAATTAAFCALLMYSILSSWMPERWAWAAFQVGVFALAALWCVAFLWLRVPVAPSPLLIPLAGAVLWSLAQRIADQTVYRWATEDAILTWFTRVVVFFLALQLFRAGGVRRPFLRGLVVFAFVLSFLSVLHRFGFGDVNRMWPFTYRNHYAAFMETVVPIAVVAALEDSRRALAWVAMAAVMSASVVATTSRAGTALVFAEIAVIIVVALLQRRISRPTAVRLLAGFALFFALFGAAVGWALWQKLQGVRPYVERRAELVHASLEMIRDRPWTGCGLGTWSMAYPAYAKFDDGLFDNQAHSDWAQWAAEGGLPFLLLMGSIPALLVRPALRSLWGIGLLCVLAHCLVDYPFQGKQAFGVFFFALAGAVCGAAPSHNGPSDAK